MAELKHSTEIKVRESNFLLTKERNSYAFFFLSASSYVFTSLPVSTHEMQKYAGLYYMAQGGLGRKQRLGKIVWMVKI